MEVISELNQPNPPGKRSITRQYGVSEATTGKVWSKSEDIRKRSALMSDEAKKKTFRAFVGRFTAVEHKSYLWIDRMRRANPPVLPSLVILKAKKIAKELLSPITARNFENFWHYDIINGSLNLKVRVTV